MKRLDSYNNDCWRACAYKKYMGCVTKYMGFMRSLNDEEFGSIGEKERKRQKMQYYREKMNCHKENKKISSTKERGALQKKERLGAKKKGSLCSICHGLQPRNERMKEC